MFEKFGYPLTAGNGETVLTTYEGIYKDMLMDIRVYSLQKSAVHVFESKTEETAFLLLGGSVSFIWSGNEKSASRTDVFNDEPVCLHVPKGVKVTINVCEKSELLVQKTFNEKEFAPVFYNKCDIISAVSGKGLCENTAVRLVRTIFDYSNAPYSNMVLGEVLGSQGGWASYPPHHHPQPEVYYYKFERPEGFGACFIGDEVFKIKNNSFCAIPGGLTHPQVSAPGYKMYTCWMIRHFDGNPWTERIDDPDYLWLVKKDD